MKNKLLEISRNSFIAKWGVFFFLFQFWFPCLCVPLIHIHLFRLLRFTTHGYLISCCCCWFDEKMCLPFVLWMHCTTYVEQKEITSRKCCVNVSDYRLKFYFAHTFSSISIHFSKSKNSHIRIQPRTIVCAVMVIILIYAWITIITNCGKPPK